MTKEPNYIHDEHPKSNLILFMPKIDVREYRSNTVGRASQLKYWRITG